MASSERRRKIAAAVVILNYYEKKRRRAVWVRSWLQKRREKGAYENLISELVAEDPSGLQNFCRLSVMELECLFNLIGPKITKKDTKFRCAIPAKERMLVALRFLATGDSYTSLMYMFRISKSTISILVPEICEAIATLKEQFIKLPETSDEWKATAEKFNALWNFPHCVGALDGKHIVMQAPSNSGSYYYNYKHSYSIVLMALVDAQYRLIFAEVGANGRDSDGEVFKHSNLYTSLENETAGLPQPAPLPGRQQSSPYVIIAEEAFAMARYLIKPYPSVNQPAINKIFNYRLSRAHCVVENFFGIIAQRFRMLRQPLFVGPTVTKKMVLAICVLHNFLCNRGSSYATSLSYDREDPVSHQQIDGSWRSESDIGNTFFPCQRDLNNRSSDSIRRIRDEFRDHFMTQEGEIKWQDKFI